jgi:hypothetical protein
VLRRDLFAHHAAQATALRRRCGGLRHGAGGGLNGGLNGGNGRLSGGLRHGAGGGRGGSAQAATLHRGGDAGRGLWHGADRRLRDGAGQRA